jgi:glycosyltransferase involved in cell wall biosynthesis
MSGDVSIIIPSFRPPAKLVEVCRGLQALDLGTIRVVDDGSGPAYAAVFAAVADIGVTVLRHSENRGKGAAIKTGLRDALTEASYSQFLVCDDDGQHAIEDVQRVAKAATHHRFTMGIRHFSDEVPWKSRLGNFLSSRLLMGQVREDVHDTQSGLRSFDRATATWLLDIPEDKFDFELRSLMLLADVGIKPHLVPIRTVYFARNRLTRFRFFQDSFLITRTAFTHPRHGAPGWVFFLLALTLGAIAYHPQWNGDFIGDDTARVEALWNLYSLDHVFNGPLGDRPLLGLSILLDRTMDFSRGIMRLENLMLLVGMALLLRKILTLFARRQGHDFHPLWRDGVLLLFCLHPLHTQIIGHVIQRGALLAGFGGLVATWLLMQNDGDVRGRRLFAALMWMLALLAKPNIFTLPLLWWFLLPETTPRAKVRTLLPFLLLLFVPVTYYMVGGFNPQIGSLIPTPWQYFLVQGKVLLKYFSLLAYPVDLKFNHDLIIIRGTYVWWGLCVWAAILSGWLLCWRKAQLRRYAIPLTGFLLALLPESSVFPIIHQIFEHRFTVPMLYLAWALALIPSPPRFMALVVPTVAVVFIVVSIQRNRFTADYNRWALYELSHTCRVDYLQLNLVSKLILRQHMDIAAQGLAITARDCKPRPTLQRALEALVRIAQAKELVDADIKIVERYLHSDTGLAPEVQQLLSRMMLLHVGAKIATNKQACFMEAHFANQLRAMLTNEQKFREEQRMYMNAAHLCLRQKERDKVPALDFDRMRIRAILKRYFRASDPTLEADLAKAPAGVDWDYLRKLAAWGPARPK